MKRLTAAVLIVTALLAPLTAAAQSTGSREPGSTLIIPPAPRAAAPAATAPAAADAQISKPEDALTPAQHDAALAMLRETIAKHPELLREAIATMPQTSVRPSAPSAMQAPAVPAMPGDAAAQLSDTGRYVPSVGEADADVTVVQFFDYQCRYCRAVAPDLAKLQAEDKRVRIVYREFPILGDWSVLASQAALAAAQQGKYTEMHNALIGSGQGLGWPTIVRAAENLGLDTERLRADMADPALMEALQQNRALAQSLGIRGTPTFVVDGAVVAGAIPLDRLRVLVADARTRHSVAGRQSAAEPPAGTLPPAGIPTTTGSGMPFKPSDLSVAPQQR